MDSLLQAARALDTRLEILKVPRSNLPMDEWDAYEERFPSAIPTWFKQLLNDFAFIDAALELPASEIRGGSYFLFRSPVDSGYCPEDDEDHILEGWVPIAEEFDGNLWAIQVNGLPSSPVIFSIHTMGGVLVPDGKGMIYAAHNLAQLLAFAMVSTSRKEILDDRGYVDFSKRGYLMWGDDDTWLHEHNLSDPNAQHRR